MTNDDFIPIAKLYQSKGLIVWALSYFVVIFPGGQWVAALTEHWRKQVKDENEPDLKNAGLWIGRIERALIMTFLMLGSAAGVGFLVAAKSVFRFGDLNSPEHRIKAEYILIGTMLSFSLAISLALISKWWLGESITLSPE